MTRVLKSNLDDQRGGLGTGFPGEVVLSLGTENAPGATVSAVGGVHALPRALTGGVVRWNLYAELFQQRTLVASTFQAPGDNGLLFSVSGVMAQTWILRAQATSPRLLVRGAMMADSLCSGASVSVVAPATAGRGQDLPVPGTVFASPGEVAEFLDPPSGPMQIGSGGRSRVHALDAPAPAATLQLVPGERIIQINALAEVDGGSFDVLRADGSSVTVDLNPNEHISWNLAGSVAGWGFDSWSAISKFRLVTVR